MAKTIIAGLTRCYPPDDVAHVFDDGSFELIFTKGDGKRENLGFQEFRDKYDSLSHSIWYQQRLAHYLDAYHEYKSKGVINI